MSEQERWSREDVACLPRERLGHHSILKPAVWRVETAEGLVVLKDTAELPWIARPLGRFLLWRERRALERLRGVPRAPQLVARIGATALAYRWIPGGPLEHVAFRQRPQGLARELREIVSCFHGARVYHLDLHRKKNLLLDEQGRLAVVDLGAAVVLGPLADRILGPLLAWVDRQAVLKYLARYAPEHLTLAEARAVCRRHRLRRLWIFTSSGTRDEYDAARRRLESADGPPNNEPRQLSR